MRLKILGKIRGAAQWIKGLSSDLENSWFYYIWRNFGQERAGVNWVKETV